ncbi:MAG TPA: hypothetical protein PKZ62_06950, partial [Thermoclostridium caenicola]|uniref:hypothetical protein n=1 Tax=Thermoclostridium caenicola TaxID=659425 RepID=UPI002BC5B704
VGVPKFLSLGTPTFIIEPFFCVLSQCDLDFYGLPFCAVVIASAASAERGNLRIKIVKKPTKYAAYMIQYTYRIISEK